MSGPRPVRAPRGSTLTCRGWQQEAAMRMLMNNLDPEVAERPDDLVVYGGTGRAARSWDAFDAMIRTLTTLADDETMLVQSGKPVGVFRTHEWAPRVLIANSNLVPEWGNWEEFRRLEAMGLTMYGQMTAGSWIYIGTQGILQGTYECFAEIAARKFAGTLAGTITLTAGLGGMGGAQPLAVTMNDGVALVHRRRPVAGRSVASRPATSTRSPTRSTTRSPDASAPATRSGRCRSASSATPPIVVPAAARAGLPRRHRHRPDERPRSAELRARRPHAGGDGADGDRPIRRSSSVALARAWPRTAGPWSASSTRAARSSTTATACAPRPAGRFRPGVRLPGLSSGLHPTALLRGQGPVPMGGALR